MNVTKPLLLRNHSFARLWIGQVLSQGCLRTYQIALMWTLVTKTSGEQGVGLQAGLFMVMSALPSLLFVNVIGRSVDRLRGKKILMTCDGLSAIIVLSVGFLTSIGSLTLTGIYISGFFLATVLSFFDPTLNKSVAELVLPKDLESAVALIASSQSMSNFAGAVLGALLIDQVGMRGVIGITAAGYLISFLCNASLTFPTAPPTGDANKKDKELSGWKVLNDFPLIRRVLIGFGCINFFSMPTLVILPLYVNQTLKGDAGLLGMLEASLWIGMLSGALLSKWIKSPQTLRLGGFCLTLFGGALLVPGLYTNAFLYMITLFIAGGALGLNNVKFIAYFQKIIPANIKGRFFALLMSLINFSLPLAYFIFGLIVDLLTPPLTILLQGAGIMAIASYFFHLASKERSEASAPELIRGEA